MQHKTSTLIHNLTVLTNSDPQTPLTLFMPATFSHMAAEHKYRLFSSHDIKFMHFYFDNTRSRTHKNTFFLKEKKLVQNIKRHKKV